MKKIMLAGAFAALIILSGCVTDTDPYSAYSAEDRAKLQADDALRQKKQNTARQEIQYQDTVTDEMINQAVITGGTRQIEGIKSRDTGVFEGRWVSAEDPYEGEIYYHYDKGTYRVNPAPVVSPWQVGVFQGDFKFFVDSTRNDGVVNGTYIMIGTFTRPDDRLEKGIYVAENVTEGTNRKYPLTFTKATPGYLKGIEQRYEQQIANYRAEQIRLANSREETGSFLNFGKVMALGLGGMMIATADIPSADRLEIGTALYKDVLSGGESNDLQNMVKRKTGSYLPSSIGGKAGTPQSTLPGAAPQSAAPTSAGQAPAPSPDNSMQYTFTCPSGTSGNVTITYKSEACLSAKNR